MGSLGEDRPEAITSSKPRNLAVHTGPDHSLYLVDSDIPEPGPDDCLVHVRATGICGSDVHFWKHGHIGDMVVCGDNGLGHESAGIVIRTGENVKNFKPGRFPVMVPARADVCRANVLRRSSGTRMRDSMLQTVLLLLSDRTVQRMSAGCLLLHSTIPRHTPSVPRPPRGLASPPSRSPLVRRRIIARAAFGCTCRRRPFTASTRGSSRYLRCWSYRPCVSIGGQRCWCGTYCNHRH
jgi:hypothetical protein